MIQKKPTEAVVQTHQLTGADTRDVIASKKGLHSALISLPRVNAQKSTNANLNNSAVSRIPARKLVQSICLMNLLFIPLSIWVVYFGQLLANKRTGIPGFDKDIW